MKLKLFVISSVLLFGSCNNNKNTSESREKASNLKSDILFNSSVFKPYSKTDKNDIITLIITGKRFLEGTATLKVVNEKGEEIHCETFPAKKLIQREYKTANSTLQEVHIREVAEGFFVDDQDYKRPITKL